MTFWARFALAVLAAWRLTHLLANEDGPGAVIVRLRARLGHGGWGKLMDCFFCMSMWIAIPLAFFVAPQFPAVIVAWLAISGGACLLERIGQPGVTLSRLPETDLYEAQLDERGGEEHALLRSGTNSVEER